MKFFKKCKDGGPESTVDAYVLVEIKSLFSIILLKFNQGSRENYHSHAFNALSIYLRGDCIESIIDSDNQTTEIRRKNFNLKYTPKHILHKVFALKDSWCLTFRGPWQKVWTEYNPNTKERIYLTNGRTVLKTEKDKRQRESTHK